MDDELKVPKRSPGDVAHAVVKAVVAAAPVIGGPGAELFQLLIQPPLERRRDEWMNSVAEELRKLQENGLRLENLKENDEFISAVLHASQVALRTHQKEKLEALRNAIINVAKRQAPEEAIQLMFLNFVDAFTEWHLRILRLFQNPPPQPKRLAGGLSDVLEGAFPELKGEREFYDSVWRDLYLRGLVGAETLHSIATGSGLAQKRTTAFGDKFLAFIGNTST